MRSLPRWLVLFVLSASIYGQSSTAPAGLVVHEWGTFTSMQGSDGLSLEGLHHEEEALPAFVYNRSEIRDCPLRAHGWKGLEVPATHVTQKMETPVIYFYTTKPLLARVRVDFVKGLITQWYPVSDLLGPPEGAKDAGPLDFRKIDRSFLQWDLRLIPDDGKEATPDLPSVGDDHPWALARRTRAAFVETKARQGPARQGPVEAEKYLFYRGLGSFDLKLTATTSGERSTLANGLGQPVPRAFAVEIKDGRGACRDLGAIAPNTDSAFDFREARRLELDAFVVELRKAVATALVDDGGLYADEAEAMTATWARQWFRTPGRRIIYLLPRPLVDQLLPLSIEPKPESLVRVLVGRLEMILPETERAVERALKARKSDDRSARAAAERELAALDRFLEPHVRRVLAATKDKEVAASAAEILTTLK